MTRARIVLAILAVLATACPTSSPVSEGPSPSGSPSLVSTGLAGRLVIVTKAPPSAMPLLDAIDEMNPDGSGERQLPIGDALCCENPALSPDGTRLLVTGEGTIGVSDVDGKNGASLAPGTSVGSYWAPTWSPSGTTASNMNSFVAAIFKPSGEGFKAAGRHPAGWQHSQ